MSRALTQREITKDEIVLGILAAVERDAALTQRRVSSEFGIALGLVNSCLKRCINKGYIKVRQAPTRRYAYYLTPTGFAEKSRLTASFLARSFSFFRRAKMQCNALLSGCAGRGVRSITLLGRGDLADIVVLLANNHGITVVEVADHDGDAQSVVSDARAADHYVITSLARPHELYAEALRAFGEAKVSAPELLGLPAASPVIGADASRTGR